MISILTDMVIYKDYLLGPQTTYVLGEYKIIRKARPIVDGYLRFLELKRHSPLHGMTSINWRLDSNGIKKRIMTYHWRQTPLDGLEVVVLRVICIIIYGRLLGI